LDTIMQKFDSHTFSKKKSTSARKKTYEYLKANILSDRYRPGERLTEEYLAGELGVSRTPIREALHKLEAEGLIKPLEKRGFCVATDSLEEMEDLFDIRAALEGYAIRLICEFISEQTIKRLKGFIKKAEDALRRKKMDEIFRCNTQFHDTLHAVITRKPRYHSLIANMRKYVLRYRKNSLHDIDGAKRTIDGHRKILLALSLKDPALCEHVMREHIQEAKADAIHKALTKKEGLATEI